MTSRISPYAGAVGQPVQERTRWGEQYRRSEDDIQFELALAESKDDAEYKTIPAKAMPRKSIKADPSANPTQSPRGSAAKGSVGLEPRTTSYALQSDGFGTLHFNSEEERLEAMQRYRVASAAAKDTRPTIQQRTSSRGPNKMADPSQLRDNQPTGKRTTSVGPLTLQEPARDRNARWCAGEKPGGRTNTRRARI